MTNLKNNFIGFISMDVMRHEVLKWRSEIIKYEKEEYILTVLKKIVRQPIIREEYKHKLDIVDNFYILSSLYKGHVKNYIAPDIKIFCITDKYNLQYLTGYYNYPPYKKTIRIDYFANYFNGTSFYDPTESDAIGYDMKDLTLSVVDDTRLRFMENTKSNEQQMLESVKIVVDEIKRIIKKQNELYFINQKTRPISKKKMDAFFNNIFKNLLYN